MAEYGVVRLWPAWPGGRTSAPDEGTAPSGRQEGLCTVKRNNDLARQPRTSCRVFFWRREIRDMVEPWLLTSANMHV
jgi:hypothetical protein